MPQANEALQPEYRGEQVLALAINLERELRGDEAHLTACAWPNCWSSYQRANGGTVTPQASLADKVAD